MSTQNQPSQWQKSITGDWHGIPAIFDADGNHVGFDHVERASRFEDGRITYTMNTRLDVTGPLRTRYEAQNFAFGVKDDGRDRIYMGPDFMGAGHPYGMVVDSHYYSPGWTSDLRTLVHVLPDGKTQVYSSLLFEGPKLVAGFNGLYKVAFDYPENPETKSFIDAHIAAERKAGPTPHLLPFKRAGVWSGELQIFDADQKPFGVSQVKIEYRPITLLRAGVEVTLTGALDKRFRYERSRVNNRHMFEGPDVLGNGVAFGRALFTTQHFYGEARKIRGREFLVDDKLNLSVVWQVFASDKPKYMVYGLLAWEPGEELLKATY